MAITLGNITINSGYTDFSTTTYYATDILVGNNYLYTLYRNMNLVSVYIKNANGTFGSLVATSYNWYNADTLIGNICVNGSSVPYAYAMYVKNGKDYLVGWSSSSYLLYEWEIDQTTHLPINRNSYSVTNSVNCGTYSRGGWNGNNYIHFMNTADYGIYRWDITNKNANMVKLGTVNSTTASNYTSSYTGSGLIVNEGKNEVYWGDGANESGGFLAGFNYISSEALTNSPITSSALSSISVPAIYTERGNIQLTALHPNLAYYLGRTVVVRQLTGFKLNLNTAPNKPTLVSPLNNGYLLNLTPPMIINVPIDSDGNTLQIRATFKNSGGTQLCQVSSSYVAQGTGMVTIIPSVNLPIGTITVILDCFDGAEWSTTNTYTFNISSQLTFTVNSSDVNISKVNMDNLKTMLTNIRTSRGLSTYDTIGTIVQNDTCIKGSHLEMMRTNTTQVLSLLNITPTWTDPNIIPNETLRKGTHWIEILNYLKQC